MIPGQAATNSAVRGRSARAASAPAFQRFARLLAPWCRALRDDVATALRQPRSPLAQAVADWGTGDFGGMDEPVEGLADAFAQCVTFALLVASEGARSQRGESGLLRRALDVLDNDGARAEVAASLDGLIRALDDAPIAAVGDPAENGHSFYEQFLAAYDPELRHAAGAFYTPHEVVACQVRLVDDLLKSRLARPLGLASHDVATLDPAAGCGNYLLGVIEHALQGSQNGSAARVPQLASLARNLHGVERMVGPAAVAQLRVSQALRDAAAEYSPGGVHVQQADTLAKPDVLPADFAEQAAVVVCLGNPPYDRHDAGDGNAGGRVRWGERGDGTDALMNDFSAPAKAAGHGTHLKNACNLYVYFWRWALWKVLECRRGPGIVCFVTASSFLQGHACCGMRECMRRRCDEIWVLDLGGERRGTRKSDNVFDVQTPVAITLAVRYGDVEERAPAAVQFARLNGTRTEKLQALDSVAGLASLAWRDCPRAWQAPLRPAGGGTYFQWPLLTDLFPWQHSGAQFKRTWPISPDAETLRRRWRALLVAQDRRAAFRETRDRKLDRDCAPLPGAQRLPPLAQLPPHAPAPRVVRYAYRSLDRHWALADARLGDFLRPALWAAHGERQVYLTTLLNHPLGRGPALTAAGEVPDLHHFRGSFGAKEVVPLYRDAAGREANVLPGLLEMLAREYGRNVSPEQFLAYVYGLLAQRAMTERFAEELGTRELRVPLTRDAALFERVAEVGARLVWLHTYGQRMVPGGEQRGYVPQGAARCTRPVPGDAAGYPQEFRYDETAQTLHVGGGRLAPVAPAVYGFEVSGLKIVPSWLGYRMKRPKGRKSSPLDRIRPDCWPAETTGELLELLWVLEATQAAYPAQAELLAAVIAGPCFRADELPAIEFVGRP